MQWDLDGDECNLKHNQFAVILVMFIQWNLAIKTTQMTGPKWS